MPLLTIFKLYRGSQFYWWKKAEDPEKTGGGGGDTLLCILFSRDFASEILRWLGYRSPDQIFVVLGHWASVEYNKN